MRNGLHYNTSIPLYVEGCSTLNKIYFIENLTPTIVSFRVRSFGMILFQSGFIGSFDLPWSEWSQITDPDHPKETQKRTQQKIREKGDLKQCTLRFSRYSNMLSLVSSQYS